MTSRLSPIRRKFWKTYQPTTLRAALEGCKEHAREARNLSVERIATDMGLNDHWSLYKWIESGRFPAVLLTTYQNVCGINLVTRWMAMHERRLLVDMPVGKAGDEDDMVALATQFSQAVQLLRDFYKSSGATDPAPVLAALRSHLESVAHHHFNVSGFSEPELDFAS